MTPVSELSSIDRLMYFIKERESVRLRKEAGEAKPWTQDSILQTYKFTNIRRMDDKVSQWLLNNWYEPYFNNGRMLVACTIARHYNVPSALDRITEWVFEKPWNEAAIKKIMRSLKAQGHKIFSGAYMVRGIGEVDKTEMVISRVVHPLTVTTEPILERSSMQRTVENLLPYWGFSSFMAGQVVADLRWAVKGDWADKHTWAPMGPGSRRGMNRLHGRPAKQPLSQEQFLGELLALIRFLEAKLPVVICRRLEAIDYQNCLCEWDKHERILWGEGRPKQRYPGV